MSKSDAQIKKDFDAFIEEIDRCTSESREIGRASCRERV